MLALKCLREMYDFPSIIAYNRRYTQLYNSISYRYFITILFDLPHHYFDQ
jgi:hypothetical protein